MLSANNPQRLVPEVDRPAWTPVGTALLSSAGPLACRLLFST
jgi:hypothetical protein